ncbi:MAG TPA: hypothetical protein PLQ20_01505 [Candidatus Paceibacterota bacterium]|nr:hypothetical protein [Candidatus Paceibacterota bacterium]
MITKTKIFVLSKLLKIISSEVWHTTEKRTSFLGKATVNLSLVVFTLKESLPYLEYFTEDRGLFEEPIPKRCLSVVPNFILQEQRKIVVRKVNSILFFISKHFQKSTLFKEKKKAPH